MAEEQVQLNRLQLTKDQAESEFWLKQINGDANFVHYMIKQYKNQHLNEQLNEQRNKTMTHRPRSSSISSPSAGPFQPAGRHLSKINDKPITSSSIQDQYQYQHQLINGNIELSKAPPLTTADGQLSSTPRRPLDDSNSSDFQPKRQTKKARPHEPTPTNRNFFFSPSHLKHAITSNLPCFYIKFDLDNDPAQQQKLPPAMKVASWIRQVIKQQSSQTLGDFSLLVPAGKNRYKIGVITKQDFLGLWKCQWPTNMDNINIDVERPRALPDCCAVVVRYVPAELTNEFVIHEIAKSIKSVAQLSKINYHRPRSTNDFRFCVTDDNEYDEILSIGRLAIGHVLLPITAFISSLKMTYCNNCWELGHTRFQCKAEPRCRICLDSWNHNHKCQKGVVCAQCKGSHASLSMECSVVVNYRRSLKEEVDKAVEEGWLHQVKMNNKSDVKVMGDKNDECYPSLRQTNKIRPAWLGVPAATSNTQKIQETNQLGELVMQMKMVVESTSRMESKLDKQVMQLDILEKKSTINKQAIFVLANIMQQMVNATLEKKNKQLLQNIAQQIEEFKDDLKEKFNLMAISSDMNHDQQQSTSTISSSPAPSSLTFNKLTNSNPKTTTLSTKGKDFLVNDKHLMDVTDDQ
jgi:hypothetical protein